MANNANQLAKPPKTLYSAIATVIVRPIEKPTANIAMIASFADTNSFINFSLLEQP